MKFITNFFKTFLLWELLKGYSGSVYPRILRSKVAKLGWANGAKFCRFFGSVGKVACGFVSGNPHRAVVFVQFFGSWVLRHVDFDEAESRHSYAVYRSALLVVNAKTNICRVVRVLPTIASGSPA